MPTQPPEPRDAFQHRLERSGARSLLFYPELSFVGVCQAFDILARAWVIVVKTPAAEREWQSPGAGGECYLCRCLGAWCSNAGSCANTLVTTEVDFRRQVGMLLSPMRTREKLRLSSPSSNGNVGFVCTRAPVRVVQPAPRTRAADSESSTR